MGQERRCKLWYCYKSVWWRGSVWNYQHLYVYFNWKKKSHCSIKFGLYRDDGLAVFKNVSEPATEKMKIYTFFSNKKSSLQIIECNLKVVIYIYLIVTFNLNDRFYRPYRTPNDKTHCYHIHSDHPPFISKQLSRSIGKRLPTLSSPKEILIK